MIGPLVEKRDGSWRDMRCVDCGCTMRHNVVNHFYVCRHCGHVIETSGEKRK